MATAATTVWKAARATTSTSAATATTSSPTWSATTSCAPAAATTRSMPAKASTWSSPTKAMTSSSSARTWVRRGLRRRRQRLRLRQQDHRTDDRRGGRRLDRSRRLGPAPSATTSTINSARRGQGTRRVPRRRRVRRVHRRRRRRHLVRQPRPRQVRRHVRLRLDDLHGMKFAVNVDLDTQISTRVFRCFRPMRRSTVHSGRGRFRARSITTFRGSDVTAADMPTEGFLGSALDAEGIALITGLQALLAGAGPASFDAQGRFVGGNILLGGDGSDVIEGNAAATTSSTATSGCGSASRSCRPTAPTVRPATPCSSYHDSMTTLVSGVFAGTINPGQLKIVRDIVTPTGPSADIDTAKLLRRPRQLLLLGQADGTLVVANTGGVDPLDGSDLLRHIEKVQFADGSPRHHRRDAGQRRSLNGTAQDDLILGLAGADMLNGGAGNDILVGGADGTRRRPRPRHMLTTSTAAVSAIPPAPPTGGRTGLKATTAADNRNHRPNPDRRRQQQRVAVSRRQGPTSMAPRSSAPSISGRYRSHPGLYCRAIGARRSELTATASRYSSRVTGRISFRSIRITNASALTPRNIDLSAFGTGPFTANAAIRFVTNALKPASSSLSTTSSSLARPSPPPPGTR